MAPSAVLAEGRPSFAVNSVTVPWAEDSETFSPVKPMARAADGSNGSRSARSWISLILQLPHKGVDKGKLFAGQRFSFPRATNRRDPSPTGRGFGHEHATHPILAATDERLNLLGLSFVAETLTLVEVTPMQG